MRSRLSRRSSVTRSASGDGRRPSFSRRARTKRSMGWRAATLGRAAGGRTGGTKAQCFFSAMGHRALSGQTAPSSIHRRRRAIVASGSAGCSKGMRGSSCPRRAARWISGSPRSFRGRSRSSPSSWRRSVSCPGASPPSGRCSRMRLEDGLDVADEVDLPVEGHGRRRRGFLGPGGAPRRPTRPGWRSGPRTGCRPAACARPRPRPARA